MLRPYEVEKSGGDQTPNPSAHDGHGNDPYGFDARRFYGGDSFEQSSKGINVDGWNLVDLCKWKGGVAKITADSMGTLEGPFGDIGQVLGSGFFITPDGSLVTEATNVLQANRIAVELSDGSLRNAKVVKLDRADNLALLQVEKNSPSETFETLQLAKSSRDQSVASPVVGLGYPGDRHDVFFMNGKIDRYTQLKNICRYPLSGENPLRSEILLDMHVDLGSNGPVIDQRGMVLGLIDTTDRQHRASAIPVENIRRFLDLK